MRRCPISLARNSSLKKSIFYLHKMSRFYTSVRLLPYLASFFERKLCVLAAVNAQTIAIGDFKSNNLLQTYKWEKRDPVVITVRSFAKDKGKLKKGVTRIPINDQELSEVFDVEKLYSDFKKPVEYLKKVYVEQLSLRTNVNAIQDVKVKYDGNVYTVQDLAEIKRKGTNQIVLDMECFTDAIPSVINSLRDSALNINPVQEGWAIIVPIPKVTREYRESFAKKAKAYFNKCKESIRDVQNKKIKEVTSKEKLSEDVIFRLKAQVTSIGEREVNQAEEMFKAKEKELLATD